MTLEKEQREYKNQIQIKSQSSSIHYTYIWESNKCQVHMDISYLLSRKVARYYFV